MQEVHSYSRSSRGIQCPCQVNGMVSDCSKEFLKSQYIHLSSIGVRVGMFSAAAV